MGAPHLIYSIQGVWLVSCPTHLTKEELIMSAVYQQQIEQVDRLFNAMKEHGKSARYGDILRAGIKEIILTRAIKQHKAMIITVDGYTVITFN